MFTDDDPPGRGDQDEDTEQPLDVDSIAQPSDRELAALAQRRSTPAIAGVSLRCPPVFEREAP